MLRATLHKILNVTGIVKLAHSKKYYKPVILCYHRISQEKIESHIQYLNKQFTIQPLSLFLNNALSNKPNPCHNSIALTMDDCYSQEFHNALTAITNHQVPCTFFIPTGYVKKGISMWALRFMNFLSKAGNSFIGFDGEKVEFSNKNVRQKYQTDTINRLSYSDIQTADIEEKITHLYTVNNLTDDTDKIISSNIIKENASSPFVSFQPHTETHPKLYLCNKDEVAKELQQSKEYLQEISGQEQYVFCYPYGSAKIIGNSTATVKNYFKYAVTLISGVITKNTNPLYIPRIGIYEHDTKETIQLKITIAWLKAILKRD